MSTSSDLTVDELVLQRIMFGIRQDIPNNFPQGLKFETMQDYYLDRMIHQMRWFYFGKVIDIIRYPETWWDAFKVRWFPRWLKKRYPAKFIEAKRYNVCPHISEEWSKDRGRSMHIQFLTSDGEHGRDIQKDYRDQQMSEALSKAPCSTCGSKKWAYEPREGNTYCKVCGEIQ